MQLLKVALHFISPLKLSLWWSNLDLLSQPDQLARQVALLLLLAGASELFHGLCATTWVLSTLVTMSKRGEIVTW